MIYVVFFLGCLILGWCFQNAVRSPAHKAILYSQYGIIFWLIGIGLWLWGALGGGFSWISIIAGVAIAYLVYRRVIF